ncbi:glucose-1-phosphate thymidylyltransferase RfbA [Hyphobacterium marinum]|uniref:Glucose-1-phosphate thymidylyltransferase n=1 Tax=Hyphobacterium marinum TaxID=3116574 RepID=A0ABU7LWE1_9PROT|nr:glucose-1-phosphate thymidylyltransferase RfbA [Hyphobacterium sp. Y6023]MEE2565850.1 glucose-1-phosphate thymidylyltransferase RfbA [Hyphobacterium sp. Y6023]
MTAAPWKGLILAGGTGSRLYPLTHAVNKHLLPVFDKPMIYYPLTTLMLGGLKDFVVVSTPDSIPQIKALLNSGSNWGINFTYVAQDKPGGIAEGFRVAANELQGHRVALILGDNIFYGDGLSKRIEEATKQTSGATIFGYEVADPTAFGVVELGKDGKAVSLEEKPKHPKSNFAVPGIYFYDPDVLDIAWSLKPSGRGELEITDVNRAYLERGDLNVITIGRGVAWLDGGTHADLFEAGQFIKVVEERTGLKVACPEEIAFRKGFIDRDQFAKLVDSKPTTEYQRYLSRMLSEIK